MDLVATATTTLAETYENEKAEWRAENAKHRKLADQAEYKSGCKTHEIKVLKANAIVLKDNADRAVKKAKTFEAKLLQAEQEKDQIKQQQEQERDQFKQQHEQSQQMIATLIANNTTLNANNTTLNATNAILATTNAELTKRLRMDAPDAPAGDA
jgi:hypothetical protein